MPKLTSEVAKARATKVVKGLIKNGLNESRLAVEEGVTPQAISKKVNSPLVQKTLAEYLERSFNRKYIKTKFKDGLEANKVVGYLNNKVDGTQKVSDEFVEVADLHCRHKYLVTLLECQGLLRHSSNGNNVSILTVIYANRKDPLNSSLRVEQEQTA